MEKEKNKKVYTYDLNARVAPRIITLIFKKVGEATVHFHGHTDDFSA